MKSWAAVRDGVVVHGGFDADEALVKSYPEMFKNAAAKGEYVPSWYTADVKFVDVTGIDPRPVEGFFQEANGTWVDGREFLSSTATQIVGNGTDVSVVTYRNKAKDAPTSIAFEINGIESNPVALTNGEAQVELVSSTPGDSISVVVGNQSVSIQVTEA